MDLREEEILAFESQTALAERKSVDKLGLKNSKPSNRVQKRAAAADKKCTSCGTTNTPVWRWGGETKEVLLCNACSLRIRRSASRPQRAKSPGDQPAQKQSPTQTLVASGTPHLPDGVLAELAPNEAEALNFELLRCVEYHLKAEKERLLGSTGRLPVTDEDWYAMQRLNAYNTSSMSMPIHTPPMPYASEWHLQQTPHHAGYGMIETGRLDLPAPPSSFGYMVHEPPGVRMM